MRRATCAAAAFVVAMAALSGGANAAVEQSGVAGPADGESAAAWPPFPPPVGSLRMVSYRASGKPADLDSYAQDLSGDGRSLAFTSSDRKLIPGANEYTQVYLRDLTTGAIQLVSHGVDGEPANSFMGSATMSDDGSLVAFSGLATNLVPGASGSQVYLYDVEADSVTLVSRAPSGDDGNDASKEPQISADGTHVVFQSRAVNLVPGVRLRPNTRHVYRYEIATGSVQLISQGAGGAPADEDSFNPSVSGDGNLVTFRSEASNLGAGENDSDDDIFLANVAERTLTQISRSATDRTGVSLDAEISDDGNHVVFSSTLSGLTDEPMRPDEFHVYVRDLVSGDIERVTRAFDGGLIEPSRLGNSDPLISSDGSLIAFGSYATNLMPRQNDDNGSYDTFVYDNTTNTSTLIVRNRRGEAPGQGSGPGALSGDGSYVGVASRSKDLSERDRAASIDVFLYRLS